jgi:SHS2 domain-containing protein
MKSCLQGGEMEASRMGLAAGFLEIDHTADWELYVWAPDMPGLLEQAARGMYALAGIGVEPSEGREYSIAIEAPDAEGLLVNFLSELLYREEEQGLAFDGFDLFLEQRSADEGYRLDAKLVGRRAVAREKDIKAVTYNKLRVEHGPHGLEVRIVFDV